MNNDLKSFLSAKISKLKLTANDLPDLFELATKKFPTSTADILETMVDCFYEQKKYENWLVAIEYYLDELAVNAQERYHLLARKYCGQIEQGKNFYEHNIELLKNYQWCFQKDFPSFDNLDKILLFHDQQIQSYLDKQSGVIEVLQKDSIISQERKKNYLLCEINSLANLHYLEENLNEKNYLTPLGVKNPLYLYYESFVLWTLVLMQGQLDKLLAEQRVVIFLSWGEMKDFFQSEYVKIPEIILGDKNKIAGMDKRIQDLKMIFSNKYAQEEWLKTVNKNYYAEYGEKILQNIRSRKPRILFLTTRFSTAMQYHIRDCMLACQSLGCETYLVMEPSNIHWIYILACSKAVHDFKPDMYFQINYFAKREVIPKEIIGVNWIQDPMPHLLKPQTSRSLSNKDYILSHYPNKEALINIGYQEQQIMDALVPANHLLYKPYPVSASEREKYATDIILVANRNNWVQEKVALVELFMQINGLEDCAKELTDILNDYYQMVYEEKINLNTQELVEQFWREQIATQCNKLWVEKISPVIVKEFFLYTRAVVFRNVLVEWLIDGGYTNLKLYGNDWGDNPKFAPYAMGVAPNGETLAKIYQSAKILLGTNVQTTSTARVFECFLSGGFYLANYITPESDVADIRKKYLEKEEIPFFYHRKDLYTKLDYYLANPEERNKIAERTRKKVLENSTYEVLMKKMLNWLAEKV